MSTHASYVIAYEIAKPGKSFLEKEFVKNCMLKVAKILCPDKQCAFQIANLSQMKITRRVEEINSDTNDQLNSNIKKILISIAGFG